MQPQPTQQPPIHLPPPPEQRAYWQQFKKRPVHRFSHPVQPSYPNYKPSPQSFYSPLAYYPPQQPHDPPYFQHPHAPQFNYPQPIYPYPIQPYAPQIYYQQHMLPNQQINLFRTKQYGCLWRGLYCLFIGWWLGLIWTIIALVICATFIGLPAGLAMLNMLPTVLTLQQH